jgi:hypothetical protein
MQVRLFGDREANPLAAAPASRLPKMSRSGHLPQNDFPCGSEGPEKTRLRTD